LLVVAFAGCVAYQIDDDQNDDDEDHDAQVEDALKIAAQDTSGVTDSTIQNLKFTTDPEVEYALNRRSEMLSYPQHAQKHLLERKHVEVAEKKDAAAKTDAEAYAAEKKETQADTPAVTDSTIQNLKFADPEVEYAQKNLLERQKAEAAQAAEPNDADAKVDPEVAYASSHEEEADTALQERKFAETALQDAPAPAPMAVQPASPADAKPTKAEVAAKAKAKKAAAAAEAKAKKAAAAAEAKATKAAAAAEAKAAKAAAAAEAKATKAQTKAEVAADAKNAHRAAATAKEAATVATKVAHHSIKITEHAKKSLGNAQSALNRARVETSGLSNAQKKSLKEAERQLKEATKDAEYGVVKDASYVKAEVANKPLKKLVKKMDEEKKKQKKKQKKEKAEEKAGAKPAAAAPLVDNSSELAAMHKELEALRKQLKAMQGDDADDQTIKDLEKQIDDMAKAEKKEDKVDSKSHDEMKAEIEKLRQQLEAAQAEDAKNAAAAAKLKAKAAADAKAAKAAAAAAAAKAKAAAAGKSAAEAEAAAAAAAAAADAEPEYPVADKEQAATIHKLPAQVTPAPDSSNAEASAVAVGTSKGLDIDTAMPYGELEPFGREDTAQELTESSIKESNSMVDQLEKAEVAEEKRSVFRALTRLRGAAITSYDGVARSQTGNIDEYNKIHQWRKAHPVHHLANEESDVTKWAFPDNAD